MPASPFRTIRIAVIALALGIAIFAVIHALPPRTITIETGPVGGSYADVATKYGNIMREHGIHVVLRPNADSLDIINDVERAGSGVDIGFTAQEVRREQFPNTAAAGAVELQPLFVFYNIGMGAIATPTNLRGKRIVLPPERSATSEVALRVLRLFDITPDNTRVTYLPLADAARALAAGDFDAGMFLLAPSNAFVVSLLNNDNLRLLSMAEGKGITRQLPFLRTTIVPRGSYDLKQDVPPEDVELLAATVNVVVRKDIHPAVLYTLLDAMAAVHHGATLISDAGAFPSVVGTDLLPHPLALEYAKSGLPWVYRSLPLWLASLIDYYLIIGVLIFLVTEIYKSLKYLSELTNFMLEKLCWQVLVHIERRARTGRPVGGVRGHLVRVIERAMLRIGKHERSEELIGRIRGYAERPR